MEIKEMVSAIISNNQTLCRELELRNSEIDRLLAIIEHSAGVACRSSLKKR